MSDLALDPLALFDDGVGSTEVGIGGRHIVQALVVGLVKDPDRVGRPAQRRQKSLSVAASEAPKACIIQ